MSQIVDLSSYSENKPHRIKRILWIVVNATIFQLLPGPPLRHIRTFLLKIFGAKIPYCSSVYHTCEIYAPWNLEVGNYTCIGPHSKIYNKDQIIIGNNCTISQGAFLCTASHNIRNRYNTLITKPIIVNNYAWVAADAYINMGVVIGEGSVVGARAAVFKDVAPWTVVGGNPAKPLSKRIVE